MRTDTMLGKKIDEFRKREGGEYGEMRWRCKSLDNSNVLSLKYLLGSTIRKIGKMVGTVDLDLLIEGAIVDWRFSAQGARLTEKYKYCNELSSDHGKIKERDVEPERMNVLFRLLVRSCLRTMGSNISLNSLHKPEQSRLRKSQKAKKV